MAAPLLNVSLIHYLQPIAIVVNHCCVVEVLILITNSCRLLDLTVLSYSERGTINMKIIYELGTNLLYMN